MKRISLQKRLSAVGLLLLLSACNSTPFTHHGHDESEATIVADQSLEDALRTLDRLSLQVISDDFNGTLDNAIQNMGEVRVVFVGETHTRYEHHLVQLALVRALHRQNSKLGLGVEWFQQDLQEPLNDYLAGRIDEATMLQRTEYYERWRYDYRLYRPLVEYAKLHQLPIIALNAPVALTDKVGSAGLDSLSPEDRAQLPPQMDNSDPAYRERIRAAYDLHPESDQPFERFISVQTVWDETMAENSARFLKANPEHRLVVLAGTGHAGYRTGIPDRLVGRVPVSTVTIATINEQPKGAPESGGADILVLAPPLQLEPSGKLGVMVNTRNAGVTISGVLEESGAYRAGIRKADQIIKLDGRPIQSFSDLKFALMDKRPGDAVAVEVQDTAGTARQVEVVLQ